jgi:hypothetical protein
MQKIRSHGLLVETLDVSLVEKAVVHAKLETSFLGMSTIFWLGNGTELDSRVNTLWVSYCARYKGPNTLFWFVSREQELPALTNALVVDLEDHCSVRDFNQLAVLFSKDYEKGVPAFSASLFKAYDKITLEQACFFMNYSAVLGAKADQFFNQWANSLVLPEKSLFTLSQLFFAKDSSAFFKQWSLICNDYPEVFWVTFWSEQVWRAYYYVEYMQKRSFAEAKKIGFRLPFALLQRDWKNLQLSELKKAHNALYIGDFHVKNSGSAALLESFYLKFFKGFL